MGREVRRVPSTWEHPRDDRGRYVPLFGGSVSKAQKEWDEEAAQWFQGRMLDHLNPERIFVDVGQKCAMSYEEWNGARPKVENYMPDWSDFERTHYQMYETTSEGTPISPVMESPEILARWLADHEASAFADQTASYEDWLRVIREGDPMLPVFYKRF